MLRIIPTLLAAAGSAAAAAAAAGGSAFAAPHYACTWSLQNYMALDLPQSANVSSAPFMGGGGNALAQAHINATYLLRAPDAECRGCGWAASLHPRARARMTLLLDAGWEGGDGGVACPDPAKFPPSPPGASCEAQLAAIAAGVQKQGWRSLGLWFGNVDRNATAMVLATGGAGVGYLKIDGGDRPNTLTPIARALAPGMVVEHANGAGPINAGGPDGHGFAPADAAAWVALATTTDTFRTYDVTQQLAVPTTLARVSGMLPLLDAIPRRPGSGPDGGMPPRAILNAEDECILSVALIGACGIMRYSQTGLREPDFDLFFPDPFPVPSTRQIKRKMDEIERAMRWQDLFAPPLGAGDLAVWGGSSTNASLADVVALSDTYEFKDGSHWDAGLIGTVQTQSAPARVARGLPELPRVVPSGLPPLELADPSLGPALASAVPFVVASRHANGAFALAALGRVDATALWFFPRANVSLPVDNSGSLSVVGPFALFGHFAAVTLSFRVDFRLAGSPRFLASDLLGGDAIDITASVRVSADGLSACVPGSVIDAVGLSAASPGDASDPGMLLVLAPPAPLPAPQVAVGNVAVMPQVPASYALVDWRARASAFVEHVFSNASIALGTTEVYTSSSAGPSEGLRAFDIATYVGAPPKREAFPPLETILSAAMLGMRRLDSGCSQSVDDCVATALQFVQADGVVGHYVAPSAPVAGAATVINGGDLWDALYSGILFASVAAAYPNYPRLGELLVGNALRWHGALVALGGGTEALDLNISGFNFSSMTGIADPVLFRQPSSSADIAWLAMAALEWQRYRNASAPPRAELEEALAWSLTYLNEERNRSIFFENLLPYGALAAARSNAERGTSFDVGRMLDLAFQDGSENQKHGWGVIVDSWGSLDVSGLVGFASEWDPSFPWGQGGREAYLGDGLWLAGAALPIVRYNSSFSHALGRFLINVCSASRLFFEDQLPPDHQTDAGDPRNVGSVFGYEALRACDFVRESNNCTSNSPSPFQTGDYGCEYPTGSPSCANRGPPCPSCTNLAGYSSASIGIAAALCVPTDVRAVLQADLLATDLFHAPAFPTFLVANPHAETVTVSVAVPSCALVHWSAAGRGHADAASSLCAVVDANSGAVLARGVAAPDSVAIDVAPDSAVVIKCVPDADGW